MKFIRYSYLSPKAKVSRSLTHGHGVFAARKIKKGEIAAIWGGLIMTSGSLKKNKKFLTDQGFSESVQVSDNHYLTGVGLPGPMEDVDYFNHSCSPNIGIKGQIILVAMRNISAGQELTLDYAMIETRDARLNIKCQCGSKKCRGKITKDDWKRKDLQKKYKGYFPWFIEEKIKKFK